MELKRNANESSAWKAMTYNIHAGVGTDGKRDLSRIADVIAKEQPDFVFLQEVDKNTKRSGGVDQTAVLAEMSGMSEYAFGRAMHYDGGEYGNAILSKYPLRVIHNLALPGEEPRAALFAEADLSAVCGEGQAITLIAVHLDWQDERARFRSVADMEACIDGLPALPALLGGDLNDLPASPVLNAFTKRWTLQDLGQSLLTEPSPEPVHQIDYILYCGAGNWAVRESYVIPDSVASDHRPLVFILDLKP
ncbi:endonuclease/exonuclease/phosphatase family protein [Paenibacillus sp. MBLB4367]|uniref:endonuclease/exonuclease/phosphatase family protein n=1 Tax=Paenibacillus sp. MBLB4367 TaxID=3384767 RepID=UPI003907EFDF